MSIKRRKLLSQIAIGATTATVIGACGESQKTTNASINGLPNIRWRMAASWPKSLDTIFGGAETICRRVSALTGGRFQIQPFASGEIVPGLQVMDAIVDGTVECGHTGTLYYIGKNPAVAFFDAVPFGLNASQQNAWLYHGGGLDAMQKIYSDFGLVAFPAGNTGVQMGGWFNRRINSLEDLKGLRMRIPGLGGQVMAQLGVNVQVLPAGEIFLALERGTVDAAEFIGPYDDEKLGLNKTAPFYYYPGWWEPGPTQYLIINQSKWVKLPKEYQEILATSAMEAGVTMLAKYNNLNRQAIKRIIASNTELIPYPIDVLKAAQNTAWQLYDDYASKDKVFRDLYANWRQFREEISQWHKINELSLANFTATEKF